MTERGKGMEIYKTRYQAEKEKRESAWHSTADKVVKVEGGYVIMTDSEYRTWKGQK